MQPEQQYAATCQTSPLQPSNRIYDQQMHYSLQFSIQLGSIRVTYGRLLISMHICYSEGIAFLSVTCTRSSNQRSSTAFDFDSACSFVRKQRTSTEIRQYCMLQAATCIIAKLFSKTSIRYNGSSVMKFSLSHHPQQSPGPLLRLSLSVVSLGTCTVRPKYSFTLYHTRLSWSPL